MSEGVTEQIQKVKDAHDAERRKLEAESEDEPCDLCEVVSADREEVVQAEQSGRKQRVALCEGCWNKLNRYNAGEDVDFGPDLRLNDRSVDSGTERSGGGEV